MSYHTLSFSEHGREATSGASVRAYSDRPDTYHTHASSALSRFSEWKPRVCVNFPCPFGGPKTVGAKPSVRTLPMPLFWVSSTQPSPDSTPAGGVLWRKTKALVMYDSARAPGFSDQQGVGEKENWLKVMIPTTREGNRSGKGKSTANKTALIH